VFFNLNTRLAGPTWTHHEYPGQRRNFGPGKVQLRGGRMMPNLIAVVIRRRGRRRPLKQRLVID
jgi:hypothetical protein